MPPDVDSKLDSVKVATAYQVLDTLVEADPETAIEQLQELQALAEPQPFLRAYGQILWSIADMNMLRQEASEARIDSMLRDPYCMEHPVLSRLLSFMNIETQLGFQPLDLAQLSRDADTVYARFPLDESIRERWRLRYDLRLASRSLHESDVASCAFYLNQCEENLQRNPCPSLDYAVRYRQGFQLYYQADYPLALEQFRKACDLGGRTPMQRNTCAKSVHFEGIIARELGDTAKWLELTQASIDEFLELGSTDCVPPLLDLVYGDLIAGTGELAAERIRQASQWAKQKQEPYMLAAVSYTEGLMEFEAKNYREAIGFLEQAIDLYPNSMQVQHDCLPTIHRSYAALDQMDSAYHTLLRSEALNNELHSAEILSETRKNLMRLERDKQQQRIAQERNQQQELRNERYILSMTILVLGGLVTLLLIFRQRLHSSHRKLQENSRALEMALDQAEQANRVKGEFLSIMSHEIRTPLNGVIGMTQLLKSKGLSDDQAESVRLIDQSSQHLLRLINDILDYSKLESGRMKLESRMFDLKATCQHVIDSLHPREANPNLSVTLAWQDGLEAARMGDQTRLTQVLSNLVHNAVKFTPKGSVRLVVEGSGERVGFQVVDTGKGILPEKQRLVFERFTQEDTGTTREYGGTGLGLAICKDLVEIMGGTLQLTSEVDRGSVFSFSVELPVAVLSMEDSAQLQASNTSKALKGKHILVVEDNPVNQLVVKQCLNLWQANSTVVNNGKEALDALTETQYSIVLMDVQMPVMDGFQATQHIRAMSDPSIREIPIIALTASALPNEVERMKASGMNDLVIKPFDLEELREKILLNLRA